MADAFEHLFYLYIQSGTNQMVENLANGREPGKAASPCPPRRADDLSTKINPGSICVHALDPDSPHASVAEQLRSGEAEAVWAAQFVAFEAFEAAHEKAAKAARSRSCHLQILEQMCQSERDEREQTFISGRGGELAGWEKAGAVSARGVSGTHTSPRRRQLRGSA